MIAALYVETGGVYYGLPDVDPWDQERDARDYPGPYPVVAHPPCKRWGAFWSGGPSAPNRRLKGDDGGCFDRAVWCVRNYGGVLEHPAGSHAWAAYGLPIPLVKGWQRGLCGGWSCCVEQGHYGHRARKKTWLYAHGIDLSDIVWGPSSATFPLEDMGHAERRTTPIPFRDLLLDMARSVNAEAA